MMRFDEKYNRSAFCDFLKEFLPEDYTEKEKDIAEVDKCKIITQAKELGYSESLDVYVLEMTHAKDTDPRVAIATDAFRTLANYGIDKALVIFKNDDSDNYRFSYLTITLNLNDKNKIVRRYSNARRYSFYLGTGAKVKTPEQQLFKKGKVKNQEDLLSRFSVEVVNKQFYLEIANYFDELTDGEKDNLLLPGVSQEDSSTRKSFAVRLIGRIMFCWFLKHKKSSEGQLIPDGLLSSVVVTKNYYHSILEPLFFGILNTSIEHRDIRGAVFDKVPYLNGGLFNPQSEDFYELDRTTFMSKHMNTLKISHDWFKSFFELLETYNFTIDENTIFDQELSVDPEMLGRIFENLLAEINPETGSSERKRTGSYYTPRQIVEYMVDQSLTEYLKTKTSIEEIKIRALLSYDLDDDLEFPLTEDDKVSVVKAIDELKILDPACGSGAYPIGVLQKIVYVLQQIDPECKLWLDEKLKLIPEMYRQKIINEVQSNPFDYTRKLEVIKNSIFGVDIQPIAVDVSRLRCFLTLVVEAEIKDTEPNRGIEPLPNLDFKFVCANTLIPAPEQVDTESGALFGDNFQEKLAVAVDKYFSSSGENKRLANNEIHKLIDGKVDEKLLYLRSLTSYHGDEKFEKALAISNKKKIDEQSRSLALWGSYKNIFENKPVGFFDPKYFFPSIKDGFDIVIGNPPYNVKLLEHEKKFYKTNYVSVRSGRQDTAAIFVEAAKKFSNSSFIISFIIPYRLFSRKRNHGAFQEYVLKHLSINEIVYLGKDAGFDSASDEFMMVLFERADPFNKIRICSKPELNKLNNLIFTEISQNLFEKNNEININSSKFNIDILSKIETAGPRLSEICHVKDGIVPYIREKMINQEKIDERYVKFAGVSGAYKLDRYNFVAKPMYLCYDLNEAKKYITSIDELRKVQLRDKEIFLQPEKIITSQNSAILKGTIDRDQYFVSNSIHSTFLREEYKDQYSLVFILACINSPVLNYYYNSKRLKGVDLHPQILITTLKLLPVPKVEEKNRSKLSRLETLVNQVLEIKKESLDSDTTAIEHQINQLVYEFYNLTEEEIKIIENVA
ncbi:MAG: Eco57I restriction-modification methylase domain-containing protein [Candidatus Moranbacteria bacterium]|nr:Eco57I restriction-modification methylase domain-containing protein [Candidatus Moranbacteria bacterium]